MMKTLVINQDILSCYLLMEGAIGNGLNSWYVRIYQKMLDSDSSVQVGPDINGEVGDFSGSNVSLFANGK
jgi:hypothetical protein